MLPWCAYLVLSLQVTGNSLDEDVEAFLKAGANAVLPKPISKRLLEIKLNELGVAYQ